MALFLRPLDQVRTETLFCPLCFRQINGCGNAGDFVSRKEHRRAKMVERKPATGKPASEAFNEWNHITRRKCCQRQNHSLAALWREELLTPLNHTGIEIRTWQRHKITQHIRERFICIFNVRRIANDDTESSIVQYLLKCALPVK